MINATKFGNENLFREPFGDCGCNNRYWPITHANSYNVQADTNQTGIPVLQEVLTDVINQLI